VFDLSSDHILLAGLGVAIVLAHWFPRLFSGREPAAAALLIGLGWALFALVPKMPGAIDPLSAAWVCERVSEMCVIVSLFGVGLRIDKLWAMEPWRATIRLLLVAMPLTIVTIALLGWWMAGLSFAAALLLGAVLAPTDPVLASDVQVGRPTEGGEHPVRFALTTEAGLNDGLAFPFVHLALLLAGTTALGWAGLGEWAARDLVYRIVVGVAGGFVVGRMLSVLLFTFPRRNPLADTESGVVAFAGVLAAYGLTELAEGYGFVAAFVAGLTVRRTESGHAFHGRLHDFSEALERALTALLLVGLGVALPVTLAELEWQGALVAVLLIVAVRPLAGWLSLTGALATTRQRLVVAVYGIRGIGSLYYLAYATTHHDWAEGPQLWAIVSFAIVLSTVLHGFTAGIAVERAVSQPGTQDPPAR
jgi:NhaP-type Na+/H+ or K+/H+ antiporter